MDNVEFTRQEVSQILQYLSAKPWEEVNPLMVMIIDKMNQTEESQN